MRFEVTCRVWQETKRGGFGYVAHTIEVAEPAEAPSEALTAAQVGKWGTVVTVRPQAGQPVEV